MILLEVMFERDGVYELRPQHKFYTKELMIEFFDIEKPKVGSYILMNKKLLDEKYEGYCQPYCFEFYMEYEDKNVLPVDNPEYIVIFNKNKNIIMQRVYG